MTFVEAVNILQKRFGDELSNERRLMKKYVKNHPEDRIIVEAFEVYIKVVRMPKKGEKRINWDEEPYRSKRKDRYFKFWNLYDTQTNRSYKFDTAQEVADFVGLGVTTVMVARKKGTLLTKRYKVYAVKS